jgi:hypothetical protein
MVKFNEIFVAGRISKAVGRSYFPGSLISCNCCCFDEALPGGKIPVTAGQFV